MTSVPLSVDEMKTLTSTKDCTANHIDNSRVYLSWNDMTWKIVGEIEIFNVSKKEVCKPKSAVTNIFLPGEDLVLN